MVHQIAHVVVALARVYGWEREGKTILARGDERVHIVNVAHLVRILGWERGSMILRIKGQVTYGRLRESMRAELPQA